MQSASAWKEDKDLTDGFLQWNSHAYGKGVYGEQSHKTLVQQLGSVDLTFNKSVTDKYDLLGCCCYFRRPWRPDQCRPGLSGHDRP